MPVQTPEIEEKVEIDPEIWSEIHEERQVIVHCTFFNHYTEAMGIRVWKSTFLICDESGHRSALIRAFNIPYQPQWMWLYPAQSHTFTMVFEALPKGCTSFTFKEVIKESGAFIVSGIARNKKDVYKIRLD